MTQIIISIIEKANHEGGIKGSYVTHIDNPELFSINVELNTGSIVLVPIELIQDFESNSNITVKDRIEILLQ